MTIVANRPPVSADVILEMIRPVYHAANKKGPVRSLNYNFVFELHGPGSGPGQRNAKRLCRKAFALVAGVGFMRFAPGRRRFAATQVQLPPFITGPSGAREFWVRRDEVTDAEAPTGCRYGA